MANKKEQLQGLLSAFTGVGEKPETEAEAAAQDQEQKEEELINTIEDERLRAALHERRMDGRGRPRKDAAHKNGGAEYSRTSLIVNQKKYAKVKEIAFRQTLTTKEVLEVAMDLLIEKYESKHGEVKPHPEKHKGDIKRLFD